MRILLVNPGRLDDEGRTVQPGREIAYGLTLPYLAALIPGRHEIKIIDENIELCDPDQPADAVFFTAMSSRVDRAYDLAARFRRRGVKTVLGGIHASVLPDEAAEKVDAVAMGEAETIVPALVEDLAAGRLKDRYMGEQTDLVGLPTPRYELLNFPRYLLRMDPVQVVRGCPNRCRYCTVSDIYGSSYRYRPTADVIRDLDAASPFVFFIDDNLMADRDRALELFRAMKGRGKIWMAQATHTVAADTELITAARDAGLIMLYVGIETLSRKGLESVGKQVNLKVDLGESIDIIRRLGVSVMASMIVGFDEDNDESMEQMVRFLEKHHAHFLQLYILTPPPGTRYHRQMEKEGRIPPTPWYKYDGHHAITTPPGMTAAQLEDLYWRTYQRFYTPRGIMRRLLYPPRLAPALINFAIRSNLKLHRSIFMGAPEGSFAARLGPLAQRIIQHPLAQSMVRLQSK